MMKLSLMATFESEACQLARVSINNIGVLWSDGTELRYPNGRAGVANTNKLQKNWSADPER